MSIRTLVAVASATAVGGLIGGYAIAKSTYPPLDVLLSSKKTIIGQDFQYPAGTPKVTAAIVTMQPGDSTGWHHHDAPLLAWVLDGSLTVDYGADGTKTYNKGDAFLEAFRSEHNGTNTSNEETRILAVFAGADGVNNTVSSGN